jgi:hypothetical protein
LNQAENLDDAIDRRSVDNEVSRRSDAACQLDPGPP